MIVRRLAIIVLALSLVSVASPAAAGCWYNGKEYKEGARVGGFVCKDGNWVEG